MRARIVSGRPEPRRHSRRWMGDESGIALITALAVALVLTIGTTAVIQYTTSNQHATEQFTADVTADQAAETGLNQAYSILATALQNGQDVTKVDLGCGSSFDPATGASICSAQAINAQCLPQSQCAHSGVHSTGTASVFGFYTGSGTGDVTIAGITEKQGNWVISSTGYGSDPSGGSGGTISKTLIATISVSSDQNSQQNVAVWNHLYSTAPKVDGQCQTDIAGDNVFIDVPVYVTGNLCLSGYNDHIWENPWSDQWHQPQAVDVTVGGRLVMSHLGHLSCGYGDQWDNYWNGWSNRGGASSIGQCNGHPITSSTIADGCSSTITGSLADCNQSQGSTWNYFVRDPSTAGSLTPPTPDQSAYQTADPGPSHPCAGLPAGTFDNDNQPNDSLTTTFDLTPDYSYTCTGSSGGELSWNAATDTLTVNGEIYIDGNVQVTQDGIYTGKASLYVGGSFIMNCAGTGSGLNNGSCSGWSGYHNAWSTYAGTCPGYGGAYGGGGYGGWQWGWSRWGWGCSSLCAVRSCSFNDWDPNTTMLAVVALGQGNAVQLLDNGDIFQGSLYAPPESTIAFTGNDMSIQGPEVAGHFTFGDFVTIRPLPPVDNLPPGAPLVNNASATLGSPVIQG